jgi:hypothetical protein
LIPSHAATDVSSDGASAPSDMRGDDDDAAVSLLMKQSDEIGDAPSD